VAGKHKANAFGVEEEQQIIKKPDSPKLLTQFKVKLAEYKARIEQKEKGWDWTINAAYKALILESLLDVSEGGQIGMKDLQRVAWEKLVSGPMNVAGTTHIDMFPRAWRVIWAYINDPENISDGTGLPDADE